MENHLSVVQGWQTHRASMHIPWNIVQSEQTEVHASLLNLRTAVQRLRRGQMSTLVESTPVNRLDVKQMTYCPKQTHNSVKPEERYCGCTLPKQYNVVSVIDQEIDWFQWPTASLKTLATLKKKQKQKQEEDKISIKGDLAPNHIWHHTLWNLQRGWSTTCSLMCPTPSYVFKASPTYDSTSANKIATNLEKGSRVVNCEKLCVRQSRTTARKISNYYESIWPTRTRTQSTCIVLTQQGPFILWNTKIWITKPGLPAVHKTAVKGPLQLEMSKDHHHQRPTRSHSHPSRINPFQGQVSPWKPSTHK